MTAPLRVMITAAATGIGAATARAFADEGHRVHASDIDEEALSRLNDDYPDIVTTPVDVRERRGDRRLVRRRHRRSGRPRRPRQQCRHRRTDRRRRRHRLRRMARMPGSLPRLAVSAAPARRAGDEGADARAPSSTSSSTAGLYGYGQPHALCGCKMGRDRLHQVPGHRARPLQHPLQCHLPRLRSRAIGSTG